MSLKVCTVDEIDVEFIEEIRRHVVKQMAIVDEKILEESNETNFMDYQTLERIRVKIHNFLNDSITGTKHFYSFIEDEARYIYKLIEETL